LIKTKEIKENAQNNKEIKENAKNNKRNKRKCTFPMINFNLFINFIFIRIKKLIKSKKK